MKKTKKFIAFILAMAQCFLPIASHATPVASQVAAPNIVVIMVDDVAPYDLSTYHRGVGAVRTPNIDRLAKEGMTIADYYGQPSCTAGRAAFLTGQYPIRTGLTTVGNPGSPIGINAQDITIAEVLKARGYSTGQFGKHHIGDRNEHLPTVHGFDVFFGMLYALNMMEVMEQSDFPQNPNFVGRPRNMLLTHATTIDNPQIDPRFGKIGMQTIEDKGQLDSARMQRVDEEFAQAAISWMRAEKAKNKPFFLWFNPTRMHQPIKVGAPWRGRSGHGDYADAILQLDSIVGDVLNSLDSMGVAQNTIVLFTSDNGVNLQFWPQSGTASYRGQKGTTWEGGFRVPMLVRWPGHIPADSISTGMMTAEDWLPTLLGMLGDTTIAARLKAGMNIGGKDYKVNIDGYNQAEMLSGTGASKRHEFFYYAETQLAAIRVDQWKVHLAIKENWVDELRRIPGGLLFDIKLDPFERAQEGANHEIWARSKRWVINQFAPYMRAHQQSLRDFPPRQSGDRLGASALSSEN
ncbi:MAG: arylsulfatase [Hyphomonadaceae bacterium]|nr:MAG: arylsulfatase [Hyphomonadaceae bacterium]KAF0187219.1 MAG: arylsulfatase [Hyphomonadaceae bacterium]